MENEKISAKDFGERIKALRKTAGFSQQEMADLVQLSKTGYRHLEYGNHFPQTSVYFKLVEVFNISLDWLILGVIDGKHAYVSNLMKLNKNNQSLDKKDNSPLEK